MRASAAKKVGKEEGSLDQYLREISKYALLKREDEVELAVQIHVGDAEEIGRASCRERV